MSQITVLTGPERRRRWSDEERERIVAEAFSAGAIVSAVARRHDISTGQIYTWRKALTVDRATFAEAMVVDGKAATGPEVIVVELPRGGCVRLAATAPVSLASAVLRALR